MAHRRSIILFFNGGLVMATYDLEQQEQIDQFKQFWKQYGNLLTWLVLVVLSGFAAWNGYNWWQNQQAAKLRACTRRTG